MSRNSRTYVCENCKENEGIIDACEHLIYQVPVWNTEAEQEEEEQDDIPSVDSEVPPLGGSRVLFDQVTISRESIEAIVSFCVRMTTKNMLNRLERDRENLELYVQQSLVEFIMDKKVAKSAVLQTGAVFDEMEQDRTKLLRECRQFKYCGRGLQREDYTEDFQKPGEEDALPLDSLTLDALKSVFTKSIEQEKDVLTHEQADAREE